MESNDFPAILECRQPAVVVDNLVDLQRRVDTVIATVQSLPRTRESLPAVREARATLNRYYNQLETQRKLVKEEVLTDYKKAEQRYKALVKGPIDQANQLCDDFLDQVETAAKKECEERLRDYFRELCQAKGIHWLPFDRVGIRVTLAMADQKELKKPKERIAAFVDRVDADLAVIAGMADSADILTEYERTLELSTAISNVNSRKRAREIMEENRAKWAAQRAADAQAAQQIAVQAPEVVQQEKKYQADFRVTATMPMIRVLKAFLDGNHYDYQEVTDNGK